MAARASVEFRSRGCVTEALLNTIKKPDPELEGLETTASKVHQFLLDHARTVSAEDKREFLSALSEIEDVIALHRGLVLQCCIAGIKVADFVRASRKVTLKDRAILLKMETVDLLMRGGDGESQAIRDLAKYMEACINTSSKYQDTHQRLYGKKGVIERCLSAIQHTKEGLTIQEEQKFCVVQ